MDKPALSSDVAVKKRLWFVDRLKVLGLFLVILAHVELPTWLAQARTFDVPLLVFVSGYLAGRSYREGGILSYYGKRFLRLAVPAWIFTAVFWVAQSLFLPPPSVLDVVKSLLFQRDVPGLSMLWVIWVYLVCALLLPLLARMRRLPAPVSLLLMLAAVAAVEVLCFQTNLAENPVLYCTLFTAVPYGFLTWLGFSYDRMGKREKWALGGGALAAFVAFAVALGVQKGGFALMSDFKYPARVYFMAYAIPIVLLLFWLLPKLDRFPASRAVQFVSRSSLWIYLWHILALYAVKLVIADDSLWWLQYILILLVSILITWVQNFAVDLLSRKTGWRWLSVFKG